MTLAGVGKVPLGTVFGCFVLTNTLIAYLPIPLTAKVLVGLLGILLPFSYILFRSKSLGSATRQVKDAGLPTFTPWILAALGIVAFCLRFYRLDSFSTWPCTDEGWANAYSLDLFEKWDGRLLFGYQNASSLYPDLEALVFKCFQPSLWSLWLLPALFSCATVLLAYAAAKEFFPKKFSVLCAILMGFGFWPLLVGRIAEGGVMLPFLQLLSLLIWGKLHKAVDQRRGTILTVLLGMVMACGFYGPYPYWAGYWLFFHVLTVGRERQWKTLAILAATETVLLFPLGMAFLQAGMGHYIYSLWAFNSQSTWTLEKVSPLSYPFSILWSADPSGFIYRPQWGGLLNPVAGAFFLLGFAAVLKRWKDMRWNWVLGAFPFFFLPGVLSKTYEMYRIIPLLPLLVLLTALGVHSLSETGMGFKKTIGILLLASFLLDGYHLFGVYRENWAVPGPQWRHFKSLERYRAFELLDKRGRDQGPGWVFTDFINRNFDRTLDIATYPYNQARNPRLKGRAPRWVGVVFPAHLRPFLEKRLPLGEWYDLSGELPPSEEGKCLAVFSWIPDYAASFEHWAKADEGFRNVARRMRYSPDQMTYGELKAALLEVEPLIGSDPFLESCLDQKLFGVLEPSSETDLALSVVNRALQRGYPSSFFLEKKKELLRIKKEAGAHAKH